MYKLYYRFFVLGVLLSVVWSSSVNAGTVLTRDTVAVNGFCQAEKSDVMKYTDPEDIILNDSLAQIDGNFSRSRLVKLLGGSRRVVLTLDRKSVV